ncbi:hypothetical protein [Bacillus toyonensis]
MLLIFCNILSIPSLCVCRVSYINILEL